MPIQPLDIFCYYDKQRFTQFGAMDCANWYQVAAQTGKKKKALYPAMGRKHISYFGENKLIFPSEPKAIFRTIDYFYVILDTQVIQVDKHYNERVIGTVPLGAKVWFDFLPVNDFVYAILTAETIMYVITEQANGGVTMEAITDPNKPTKPYFVASFGSRFVVSQKDTRNFYLSQINLGGAPLDLNTVFTISSTNDAPLTNSASGVIGQFAVLHNQLYILCSFTTDVWSNIPSQNVLNTQTEPFPWKLNTSYNFDYGIADPDSLDVDFGMMVWLAQNKNGLVSFMASNGQKPEDISSQAINVLIENSIKLEGLSPFISGNADGFLYQYENTIFYRVSAGNYMDFGDLDIDSSATCIEYNFETQTWARDIELNGERNRIQKHIYFNNNHIVTVQDDDALYQMAGNIYSNELRTPDTDPQAPDAFTKYAMRYELVTEQIYQEDYSQFITDYVEIDFVFGDKTFYRNEAPFDNTVFIITEDADPDGCPIYVVTEDQQSGEEVFVITEDGNTPAETDNHYNSLFKPHIELYYSDDGGVTFISADLREFSQLGEYQWRMRWYELGVSINRCYKLICVSSAPICILGAVQYVKRASGGAN